MALPTTTVTGIVLVLSSYSLTIDKNSFASSFPNRYPRLPAQYTSITRSLRGVAGRRGPLNYPPSIWTFEARLTLQQEETLRRMEASYWANRRGWTIYDYTQYWSENGTTNTRALAPNSTAANDGTTVLYYPQWQAEPTQPFELSEIAGPDGSSLIAFQFTETGVVAA